jgi:hypothetical protein
MPQVRSLASYELMRLVENESMGGNDAAQTAHRFALAADIARFLERPLEPISTPVVAPSAPPGSPIGMPDMMWVNLMCEW